MAITAVTDKPISLPTGLRHAALPAQDLKRAVAFYRDVLGFEAYHTEDRDWAMVHRGGTTVSLVLVPGSAPLTAALQASKPGVHPAHLGFLMPAPADVDALHAQLKSQLPVLGKPKLHRDGSYGFYLLDSEGNQLECIFIPCAPMASRKDFQRAAILMVHGSRDPQWKMSVEPLRSLFATHTPGLKTGLAYLETAEPTLPQEVERLISEVAELKEIVVLPVFLSSGAHVSRDIPSLVEEVAKQHPGIHFSISPALGESRLVHEAFVAAAVDALYQKP